MDNDSLTKFKIRRLGILAYGFVLMFIISICYAWSVFNAPIAKEFTQWKASEFSLVFTIFMISYAIMGVMSGILIRFMKGKVYLNLLISAICLFFSFFITSRSDALWMLYLGFGFLGGTGVVFAYNSVLTVVTKWFPDLVGTVTGVLLMGYGLGSFIIGKIYSHLIQTFAWRDVFLVFGIVLAVLVVVGIFIILPPPSEFSAPKLRAPKIDKKPIEAIDCTPLQMIKRPSFWLLFGMGTLVTMASMGVTSSARNIVQAVDPTIELTTIATIIGLISIFNALGRIFTGFINDWLGLRFNILISDTLVFIMTALVGVAVLIGNITFLTISFILFGFAAGMSVPDGAVVTRKFFGEKNYQTNVQVVLLCGVFNSFGAMIMGGVFDATGNYYVPLFILSGIAFLGWICALCLRRP